MIAQPASPPRPAASPRRHYRAVAAACLLLLAAFIAYYPSLNGEPIWDDLTLVVGHPFIKSPLFTLEVFRQWTFPESVSTYYRPVQLLSYMVDYTFWRGEMLGYHLSNIAIHGGAGVLLFALLGRLIPGLVPGLAPRTSWLLAFAVALLWVVHPIHNAAVAYMSGRADPLAALFALAAWLLYLHAAAHPRRIVRMAGLAAACLLALVALCSKEIAFTWLVLFLVVHTLFLPAKRRWLLVAALVGISAAYLVLHQLPPERTPGGRLAGHPPLVRAHLVVRALGDYTQLIFWPGNLHMCRSVSPELVYPQLKEWYPDGGPAELTWIGLGTVAAFGASCLVGGRGQRLRRLGVAWFCIGFIPISNVFPLNAQVAEHWIYMPSIGFLLMLLGWALELPPRWHRFGLPFLVVATIALTVRTAVRAADWTSPFYFFGRTLQDGGYDPRVFFHYARAHSANGNLDETEQLYLRFQKSMPGYPGILLGLSEIYHQQGRTEEKEALLRGISSDHFLEYGIANLNLARIESERGNHEAALAQLELSLKGNPPALSLIPAHSEILEKLGRHEEALAELEAYTRERYWDARSLLALADFYRRNGPAEKALPLLERAARMDIWSTDAHLRGALIGLQQEDPDAALEWVRRGLKRKPAPTLYAAKAEALAKLGREAEAKEARLEARAWQVLEQKGRPSAGAAGAAGAAGSTK